MTGSSAPGHPGPREVAELLAWCRRLSMAGPDTDPAQRAAYLAAKTDLLTRITNHPDNHPARRDPARRDPARRDPARRDPARRDPARRDPARRDPARRDPARRDPARRGHRNPEEQP